MDAPWAYSLLSLVVSTRGRRRQYSGKRLPRAGDAEEIRRPKANRASERRNEVVGLDGIDEARVGRTEGDRAMTVSAGAMRGVTKLEAGPGHVGLSERVRKCGSSRTRVDFDAVIL
jgi:hypothetical protein